MVQGKKAGSLNCFLLIPCGVEKDALAKPKHSISIGSETLGKTTYVGKMVHFDCAGLFVCSFFCFLTEAWSL